jgi:hypothetical protein
MTNMVQANLASSECSEKFHSEVSYCGHNTDLCLCFQTHLTPGGYTRLLTSPNP